MQVVYACMCLEKRWLMFVFQLLEASCQASPVDADGEIYLHLINASFAGVSGRVFAAREAIGTSGTVEVPRLKSITTEIQKCKSRISDLLGMAKISDESAAIRVHYFLYTLSVFEAEMLAHLNDWDRLLAVISETIKSGPLAVETYEAIADILWMEKTCPVNGFHWFSPLRWSRGHPTRES